MKKNKKPVASLQKTDTTFASLLQEFPSDLIESAKEFEAFQRPRKIKNVDRLFQIVLLYCGLDLSLRDTAGTLTMLEAVWKLKEMNQKAKIVNYQLSIINCF